MPVGTAATVKAMLPQSVRETGADILLGNTYHLMLRPGAERIARLGGLHKFMDWQRPILTDTGGFQVMSLSALRKISEEGVRVPVAYRRHAEFLSPERAMEIQRLLGSDIQMVLDECPALPATHADDREIPGAVHALGETLQGRIRRADRRERAAPVSASCRAAPSPICAGVRPRRCRRSASTAMRWAAWRWAKPQSAMFETLDATVPHLPAGQAALSDGRGQARRHRGRGAARHRHVRLRAAHPFRPQRPGLYAAKGALNLRNARFADDPAPLDPDCALSRLPPVFSRAYLHHVVKAGEIIAAMLLTWHNLTYYQRSDGGAAAGHCRIPAASTGRRAIAARNGKADQPSVCSQ